MEYFVAVVNCNSFTEAAEECFISQSAISQQIMSLEEELGAKLLTREKRKFTLTEAGEYFYHQSLIVLEEVKQIELQTLRIANGGRSEIKIGYLITCGIEELTSAFSQFTEQHPDTQIQVKKGNHEDLFHMLQVGLIDIAINDQRRAFSDEYVNFELAKANVFVEINRKNHLSALDTITPADLKKMPCILIATKEQQQEEREYYKTIFGIGEEVLYAESLEEARLLMAGNRGYFLVESDTSTMPGNEYVKDIPLFRNGEQITKKYCAFWKKDNHREQLESFAKLLLEQFEH